MCGIAGWIDWGRPVSRERSVLKKMNQAMACRGPDDEGFGFPNTRRWSTGGWW